MARMTKKQKQDKALRTKMMTGPFTYSNLVETSGRYSAGGKADMLHPFRMTDTRFDETDHEGVRGVIDAQHARSIVNGMQTASQFGYGLYDVDVHVVYSTEALNPDTTENGIGDFQLSYFEPTPLRLQALRELKKLEVLDDESDVLTSGHVKSNTGANPLLSIDLNVTEALADETTIDRVSRGSKIIRFGWSGQTSSVCRQSSFSVNLNPDADNDATDVYENQDYVLIGGDDRHFGILERYEMSLNPIIDEFGTRLVEESWAYPTSEYMVQGLSRQRAPFTWAIADSAQGAAACAVASFKNVSALGGLIGFDIPSFTQQGTGNNDMDIVVTLRAKSWTPLA